MMNNPQWSWEIIFEWAIQLTFGLLAAEFLIGVVGGMRIRSRLRRYPVIGVILVCWRILIAVFATIAMRHWMRY